MRSHLCARASPMHLLTFAAHSLGPFNRPRTFTPAMGKKRGVQEPPGTTRHVLTTSKLVAFHLLSFEIAVCNSSVRPSGCQSD